MNPTHYPDIERCKRLSLLGFPETELGFLLSGDGEYMSGPLKRSYGNWLCPSVMELLDEMPGTIEYDGNLFTLVLFIYSCEYRYIDDKSVLRRAKRFTCDTLPNALADMIVFLHENGHIKPKPLST